MNTKGFKFLTSMLFAVIFCSQSFAQSPLAKHEALASKLVNLCANVQENDNVLISGSVRDADLLDELAIQAMKSGAFSVVNLESEQRSRRYFDVVPAKYDSRKPEMILNLMNQIDVVISVEVGESIGLFKDVPSERLAAVQKASQSVGEVFAQKNIRSVDLGNGLYPTDALAKQFGITKAQLSELFWNGINVDYMTLQKKGDAVKQILATGEKVKITSPAGTELTMEISTRPVFVSDGVISDEEMKKGFPACQVWLPAGEVYVTPVPGSAEGSILLEHFLYQDKTIEQLKLTFKAGKLVSMSAKSGLESYKERYDAAGEGKDEFGYIDLGLNPEVKIIPGSKMEAWMATGMVTVGIGNNKWAGGENVCPYGSSYHITNATVSVDGTVLIENGMLK